MTDHVVTAAADGILAIRLNRPEKKNALTVAMYAELADALERADADRSVRVVTLTGTGDSFTSGNDIADFMQQRPAAGETPVRLVGHQRASELLLLGERFDAATAREIGLINAVHPAAALAAAVQDRARLLAGKPPSAVRLTKALLRSESTGVADRMAEEGRHFASQLQSPEAREAFVAFMERRKPDFSKVS